MLVRRRQPAVRAPPAPDAPVAGAARPVRPTKKKRRALLRCVRALARLFWTVFPFCAGAAAATAALLWRPGPATLEGDATVGPPPASVATALAASKSALIAWHAVASPLVLAAATRARSVPPRAVAAAVAAASASAALLLLARATASAAAAARGCAASAAARARAALEGRRRAAARAAPHLAFAAACGAAFALAPPWLVAAAASPVGLALFSLLLPSALCVAALRQPPHIRARVAPLLLSYWAAAGVALAAGEAAPVRRALLRSLPLRATLLSISAWALHPATRGAVALSPALATRLASLGGGGRGWLRARPAPALARLASPLLASLPQPLVGAAARATPALGVCCVATLVPIPRAFARLAAPVASLLCPAAASLSAASSPPARSSDEDVARCLLYWAAYGAATAALLCAPPLAAALTWLPFRPRMRVALCVWAQLVGPRGGPAALLHPIDRALEALRSAISGVRIHPVGRDGAVVPPAPADPPPALAGGDSGAPGATG